MFPFSFTASVLVKLDLEFLLFEESTASDLVKEFYALA